MNREPTAMPYPTVRANFDEPLYVETDLTPEVTFDLIPLVNDLTDAVDLIIGKILDLNIGIDPDLGQCLPA